MKRTPGRVCRQHIRAFSFRRERTGRIPPTPINSVDIRREAAQGRRRERQPHRDLLEEHRHQRQHVGAACRRRFSSGVVGELHQPVWLFRSKHTPPPPTPLSVCELYTCQSRYDVLNIFYRAVAEPVSPLLLLWCNRSQRSEEQRHTCS